MAGGRQHGRRAGAAGPAGEAVDAGVPGDGRGPRMDLDAVYGNLLGWQRRRDPGGRGPLARGPRAQPPLARLEPGGDSVRQRDPQPRHRRDRVGGRRGGRAAAGAGPRRARDRRRPPVRDPRVPGDRLVRDVERRSQRRPAGRRSAAGRGCAGPRTGCWSRGWPPPRSRSRRRSSPSPSSGAGSGTWRPPASAPAGSWPRPRAPSARARAEGDGTGRGEPEANLMTARAFHARLHGRDDPATLGGAGRRAGATIGDPYREARARWRQAEATMSAATAGGSRRTRTDGLPGGPGRRQGATDGGGVAGDAAPGPPPAARAPGARRALPDPAPARGRRAARQAGRNEDRSATRGRARPRGGCGARIDHAGRRSWRVGRRRHVRPVTAGAGGPGADRPGPDEPRDRGPAVHQPEDGGGPRRQHPGEARRVRAGWRRRRSPSGWAWRTAARPRADSSADASRPPARARQDRPWFASIGTFRVATIRGLDAPPVARDPRCCRRPARRRVHDVRRPRLDVRTADRGPAVAGRAVGRCVCRTIDRVSIGRFAHRGPVGRGSNRGAGRRRQRRPGLGREHRVRADRDLGPGGCAVHHPLRQQGRRHPHNVAIKDPSGTEVFKGDIITGPAQADYQVPALPPGTYQFVCSVHPNMTGTLKVGG